jgi:hypothetical protein
VCLGNAATLLFKSGFESATVLPSIPGGATGTFYLQNFSGTDSSTGFNWSSFPYQNSIAVTLHDEPYGSDPIANHFQNALDTSTAHSGSQSLLLSITGYPTGVCCPQVPLQSSATSGQAKQVYYRFWQKYPASLATAMASNNSYYSRTSTSWKTLDDYRSHLNFDTVQIYPSYNWDYHNLHPHMQLDATGINASNGVSTACPYIDPITGSTYYDCSIARKFAEINNTNIAIPLNAWFLVEVSFKRSIGNDGYFDAAVNGQTVAHVSGPNYGVDGEDIQDMYWMSLYDFPIMNFGSLSQWHDDLEIWDSPPCGQFPCGSGSATSYSGPSAPVITSRYGAIAKAGSPFSFQCAATQSPSAWTLAYGSSLPPGLSLSSSGLISGTPASSGTYSFYVQAWSTYGMSMRYMTVQVNGSAGSAPTISSFTASPSTINAGQWSQLKWVQSGADSISINQGIGDVTGADPLPIQPSATTTYTITATNNAGSTTQVVTVNVNGTLGPPATPTGFTATVH